MEIIALSIFTIFPKQSYSVESSWIEIYPIRLKKYLFCTTDFFKSTILVIWARIYKDFSATVPSKFFLSKAKKSFRIGKHSEDIPSTNFIWTEVHEVLGEFFDELKDTHGVPRKKYLSFLGHLIRNNGIFCIVNAKIVTK